MQAKVFLVIKVCCTTVIYELSLSISVSLEFVELLFHRLS